MSQRGLRLLTIYAIRSKLLCLIIEISIEMKIFLPLVPISLFASHHCMGHPWLKPSLCACSSHKSCLESSNDKHRSVSNIQSTRAVTSPPEVRLGAGATTFKQAANARMPKGPQLSKFYQSQFFAGMAIVQPR